MTHDTIDDELATSLAWLRRVAAIDDSYVNRWPREAWQAWNAAMAAGRDSPTNPSVPEWMQEPIRGTWHNDFSVPFPSVGSLVTAHDWFLESDRHDDFRLEISEPSDDHAPTLEVVRRAWTLASASASSPLLAISLEPEEPWHAPHVLGAVDAFYVVGDVDDLELAARLDAILGVASSSTYLWGVGGVDQLAAAAGRDRGTQAAARAWAWMG